MIITDIIKYVGVTTIKIIAFLLMGYIAYKWSHGGFMKAENIIKKVKKTYGIGTVAFLILLWICTPTGTPDDVIAYAILATIGLGPYVILITALAMYMIWRMRITIVIYNPNNGGKKK